MTKSIDVGNRLVAGVSVPDSPLITEALEFAQKLSEPYLFNHAVRSWLFAVKIGHLKGINYDPEVVAVGTILHDIGLTAGVSGPNRFEVMAPPRRCRSSKNEASRIIAHSSSGTLSRSTRHHQSRFTRRRKLLWAPWA